MKKRISIILLVISFIFNYNSVLAFIEPDSINYNETLETFNNPERGFYEPVGLSLKPTNNKPLNYSSNLVHLRVNLGAFSEKNNGVSDLELTDEALNTLNTSLQNIKAKGGSVIIRFAYDNFDGKANYEPSLKMILRHIEQLREVFYKNRDVITYVELGFFGPWGEMHTSKICTTANISLALDKMLDAVPEEISIGVRTPNYYASFVGLERSKLDTFEPLKGTKYYRVGLYNDGYLGSESDLGTFSNRNKEIAWLNKQAKHTLYGGEVVANFGKIPINTVEYMAKEAFLTHTTYLNLRWNYQTIDNWKKEIYNGEDSLYVGETGFKYVDNHLGYRFVLRNSILKDTITNKDNLIVNYSIENVGFANLVNKKKVTIVLEGNDNIYEIETNIDPTLWDSNKIVNIKNIVELPKDIVIGSYRVYLRISYYGDLTSDNNYKTIRFANDNIWNKEIGANYIGKINIIEYVPPKQETVVIVKKPPEVIIYEPIYEPKNDDSNIIHNVEENEVKKEQKEDLNVISNVIDSNENKDQNDNANFIYKEEEYIEEKNEKDDFEITSTEDDIINTENDNMIPLYIFWSIIGLIIVLLIVKSLINKF